MLLDAPDTVLIERAVGKRIDPETGGNMEHCILLVRTLTLMVTSHLGDKPTGRQTKWATIFGRLGDAGRKGG